MTDLRDKVREILKEFKSTLHDLNEDEALDRIMALVEAEQVMTDGELNGKDLKIQSLKEELAELRAENEKLDKLASDRYGYCLKAEGKVQELQATQAKLVEALRIIEKNEKKT